MPTPARPASDRTTVRRRAGRGRYERAQIEQILDDGLAGHVAFVAGGQPYAIPMLYARRGDQVYLHGSTLSRLLETAVDGAQLCFTVTLLDGIVLARSAFHHSLNFRSVVILGAARVVREREEKLESLRVLVDHVCPGRSSGTRGPDEQELAATEVVALGLDEASAKIRTGPPIDAPEDYELPFWAGEVPLRLVTSAPERDPRCRAPLPDHVRALVG
jgi:nitroimidazol reductase NimA-like FMN-containing flavoprotein (pyridoxamine 5'-phosphate oxidase superfamily)